MPSALAIFAHPDDIEFVAAGTLLLLKERGWDIHYINLCTGNGGSVQMDGPTTTQKRLEEGREAARILGATFYPPICDDLELTYSVPNLRKVAAIVRMAQPSIVLTHAPADYMEDHMQASRLAVTAAFSHCIPNFQTDPHLPSYSHDVTVYHAMPHGQCDPLRQKLQAGQYVDTTTVHTRKRESLAAHESQKHWLDVSQGMDSYLISMDESALAMGRLSGRFEYAEGWRRHLHLGFSAKEIDPLKDALDDLCLINEAYEQAKAVPI
ncbi:MAG: PIG-L family deacetylase [Prosthecobacter sp.]|uniref:PIG-L deacetylase family protein n=1 Tax=Prosthecobacter sp. TaxID=1965333 RepID=UPI0025DBF712|nr:PIG-L family deacetylase [Prosthecobacter sp.]MCF7788111.1 PIG-L family deacetylase [Prosthecobacter sp.]